jgi:hypothetical protein
MMAKWFKLQSALALLVIAATCLTPDSAGAQPAYDTYQNGRFGFTIQYPTSFCWSESANGDGIRSAPGRGADFRASAMFNALDQSSLELFNAAVDEITEHRGGVVTYAVRLLNGFVVSGTIGDIVRYQRVIFTGAHGHDSSNAIPELTSTFWAEYPTIRKGELDLVVSTMSRSFQAGQNMY